MTKNWNKKKTVTRTKEGLFIHHKMEDRAIRLSTKEYAMQNPYEYQLAKNLVYCDYLEHLLLHILIVKHPAKVIYKDENVGIGGILSFIVPELNDLYSGFPVKQQYRKDLFNKVKNDKKVYLELIKMFAEIQLSRRINQDNVIKESDAYGILQSLRHSCGAMWGLWENKNNKEIYNDIMRVIIKILMKNKTKIMVYKDSNM